MSFNESIGEKLKDIRLQRGMSQSEVGNLIGVSFQQVQKYENGSNAISLENLDKLSQKLDISIISFIEAEKEKAIKPSHNRLQLFIFKEVRSMTPAKQEAVLKFIKTIKEL
jgi:transcriptional regulator with XRE-family HTH domain